MQEAGEGTISKWRLAAALSKTWSILRQVERLLESDFPHDDSQQALLSIKSLFAGHERNIIRRVRSASGETVGPTLGHITEDVEKYTEILGFILRSTNVRNPFEIYYPLKRLARNILGQNTMLLISSEWDFIPFTYPMNIDSLPNLVMIGMAAPESDNPLLIPLAGHEIGHSAWRKYDIFRHVDSILTTKLEHLFDSDSNLQKLGENISETATPKETIINECSRPMYSKAEEVFCDLTGLYIFGASYVYAFDYLLAPGSRHLSREYPNDWVRIQIVEKAAEAFGVSFDKSFVEGWTPHEDPTSVRSQIYEVTDRVVFESRTDIIKYVLKFFEDKSINTPRKEVITEIQNNFAVNKPYDGEVYLSEIVNAGWNRMLLMRNVKEKGYTEQVRLLKELMLKSIEVAEFRTLLSE